MRIAAVSDLHGHFPEIPECDLLLLAGDYCPVSYGQQHWFRNRFAPWINKVSEKTKIIGVAGNHDMIFQEAPHLVPEMNWTYLQDSGCEFRGLKIYGTPWQPRFFDWAFNADEDELAETWSLIPDDTDILVLHGPPRGYGDFSPFGNEHTGSLSLLARIYEIQPKLVVAGHIHSGYGRYEIGDTVFLNCAMVDEKYKPVNPAHVIELEA